MSTNLMSLKGQDIEIAKLIDRLMRRIHTGLHARASEFDTENLGPGGSMILLTLAEIEPAPISELSRRMARDKSQMTRVLKALDLKGMIIRETSDEDGRVCFIRLSPKGTQMVNVLQAVLGETVGGVLEPLSPEDREQLKTLLGQVAP